MSAEHVTLPEPARSIMLAVWDTLRTRISAPPSEAPFVLGGGTMLAARWRHRASKDVDIRVNPQGGDGLLSRIHAEPTLGEALDRDMVAAGAWAKDDRFRHVLQYGFGPPGHGDPPRLELVELLPHLRGEMTWTVSENMAFWSATNEEILAGKWIDRRHAMPTRDVFDFAVAGRKDPAALQRAIATTSGPKADLNPIIRALAAERSLHAEVAADAITNVPDDLAEIRRDPARFAAWAIGRFAMTRAEITCDKDQWQISTRCNATPNATVHGPFPDAEGTMRVARAVGAVPDEDLQDAIDTARHNGSYTHIHAAATLTEATAPRFITHPDGTINIDNFAEDPVTVENIDQAVALAIRRGWETQDEARGSREQLQKQLELARTRGRTIT